MSKYDEKFLVDYINKRIKIQSDKEHEDEVYALLYNNCRKATIDSYPPFWYSIGSTVFDVKFRKIGIDEFIKLAERVHNEYRRICGYQDGGVYNGE